MDGKPISPMRTPPRRMLSIRCLKSLPMRYAVVAADVVGEVTTASHRRTTIASPSASNWTDVPGAKVASRVISTSAIRSTTSRTPLVVTSSRPQTPRARTSRPVGPSQLTVGGPRNRLLVMSGPPKGKSLTSVWGKVPLAYAASRAVVNTSSRTVIAAANPA